MRTRHGADEPGRGAARTGPFGSPAPGRQPLRLVMHVLVLNTGSSSLKFQVVDTDLDAIEKNADRHTYREM